MDCFLSSASDVVSIDLAGIESITWTHRADSVATLDEMHTKTLICRGDIQLNVGSELWDERLSGGPGNLCIPDILSLIDLKVSVCEQKNLH